LARARGAIGEAACCGGLLSSVCAKDTPAKTIDDDNARRRAARRDIDSPYFTQFYKWEFSAQIMLEVMAWDNQQVCGMKLFFGKLAWFGLLTRRAGVTLCTTVMLL
jgi:hypothetical protein